MSRFRLKPCAAAVALALGVATSGPADAGPVVVAIAAAGASHYVGTVLAMGWLAGALAAVGTSMVLGGLTAKPGRQQEQPTFQAEMRDRLHVVRSAVEARRIVYGQVPVSGPLVYAETTGATNEYLHLVIPLAGHECQELGGVYLNDELVGALDGSGNVTTGRLAGFCRIKKHLGTAAQAADSDLVAESAGLWTTDHRLRGIAYVYVRLKWSVDVFPNGIPNVKCVVKGKKLEDTRVSPSTGWSDNWALVLRDYLTSSYGLGCGAGELNDTITSSSASTCDERVSLAATTFGCSLGDDLVHCPEFGDSLSIGTGVRFGTTGSLPPALSTGVTYYLIPIGNAKYRVATSVALAQAGSYLSISGGTGDHTMIAWDQARYTCNGTVNLADRPVDIIQSLCTAAAGAAVFSQGAWRILPGAYVTPTVDIDESWLAGSVRVLPRKPRRELYNGVRGTLSDRGKFWQPTDFPPVDNATYVTQDGGEAIWRDIELPYTDDYVRAQRIAKIHLEKSRQAQAVELPCNLKAFQVAVWDTVRLSIDLLGYSSKVFQVLSWRFDASGQVLLKLQEEASAVYDWAHGDATELDPAPDTILPNPFGDLDIAGLTATSGTADLFRQGDGTIVPRARLRWIAPANPFIQYYELQFTRRDGSPTEWVDAPDVAAPAVEGFCHPLEDGVAYDFRVRAVTTLGNAGEWAYVLSHTVVGKTELPSDVTGASAVQTGGLVVMGCSAVSDADLDSIEVRLQDDGETSWDDGTPIANILRGQTVTSAALPPGNWELLFKAKDTSGNYSANANQVSISVTSDGFSTISTNPQGVQWLGSRTNMVKHWTGVLVPDSQSLASALGWEVFDEFVPNAYTDCYYYAPVIDKSIDASARIYGDIVSVLGPGETTGVAAPMFEVDTRTSAGSFDGFEGWTVGSVAFRYLWARIHVDTTVGKPVISQFTPTIDKEAFTQTGTLTVGGGGSGSLVFATAFHTTPALQVTPQGAGDVTASYANLTATGFDGYFRTAGTLGAGTMQYAATGA